MISIMVALLFFSTYFFDGMQKPELLIAGAILWLSGSRPNVKVLNEIHTPNDDEDGTDK